MRISLQLCDVGQFLLWEGADYSIIFSFSMIHLNKQLMRIFSISILGGALAWGIVSCAQPVSEPLTELFSPTPSLTATPTILWFPQTTTPTLVTLPTATPNPAAIPAYGELLFSDPLAGAGEWLNSQDANGNVVIKDGSLTLAVNAARGSLLTLRQNTNLSDFYLETTMAVNLCKQDDQVGVLFRAEGAQSYYRLIITCSGTYAVQQVLNGTPAVLADFAPSAELQPGLYKPCKIGIWVKGSLLRIYFNDQLQAEVTRDTFKSGSIGFYARAMADTPLSVNFSDLSVYQIGNVPAPVIPSTTATP